MKTKWQQRERHGASRRWTGIPAARAVPLLFVAVASLGIAQDKKPDNSPQLLISTPLRIVAGQTTKVMLRGMRLDETKELQINGQANAAKILSKSKSAPPQKLDATRAGDSQLEVELTLPADAKPGECELVAITDAGRSAAFKLFVDARPLTAEKEPNDGFAQAQAIHIGETLEGTLHQPQNVDVFRFDCQAGDKLIFEVFAARRGSALDATLSLFDSRRQLIDTADDLPSTNVEKKPPTNDWSRRDTRLEVTLPSNGMFFLILQDANDLGSSAHPYRLHVSKRP